MNNSHPRNAAQSLEMYFFRTSSADIKKIPGCPIAYWVSQKIAGLYSGGELIGSRAKKGITTGDNHNFLRLWWEPEYVTLISGGGNKWFPTQKGGEFRRWYGNFESVLNWQNNGREIRNFKFADGRLRSVIRNESFFEKEGVTWTDVSSGKLSMRFVPEGFIFNASGPTIFSEDNISVLGLMNSKLVGVISGFISPTLHFEVGQIQNYPLLNVPPDIQTNANKLINLSKLDWDSYETSWNFTHLPLLNLNYLQPTLKAIYQKLRAHWQEMTLGMQRLEEENNRLFIDAYGLQDELTSDVTLNEITLTCNPYYRYGVHKSEDELEALLLADTLRELVSYAVGCMFGRYALDKPGLILANQGETLSDYLKQIPQPSFQADDDNVIPMLEGDWFTDDIAERFRKFLRVAFGEEHYEENLGFVELGLNIKGKRNYTIRDYFLGEFYNDHVKRYKKRPIYWLFSSPKGSFNALIYMHRYRPDTVSVVLNDYLREFRTKLTSEKNRQEALSISASAGQGEKNKALKEIEKITKMIAELEEYEREVLYPLATEQVEIDLDDGVKVNYPKLGAALKRIVGLDAADE